MVSRVIPVEPFDLIIFGGTGDLARRKILPALFRRYCSGQMPESSRVIGAAHSVIIHHTLVGHSARALLRPRRSEVVPLLACR